MLSFECPGLWIPSRVHSSSKNGFESWDPTAIVRGASMRWWTPPPPKRKVQSGRMGKLVWMLSRLEPIIVSILSSTPVFSDDEKKELLGDFRKMRQRWVDGLSRTVTSNRVTEGRVEFPDKKYFELDDISLTVKLNRTEDNLLYFVTLGLTSLERLYLTNHLSEVEYLKYRKVLRYLPRFHSELVKRMDNGRQVNGVN
jgi:hypothetical protein